MHHLAQVNVSRMVAPLHSRTMRGFVAAADRVNAAAEAAPGFVWRLRADSPEATAAPFLGDPTLVVNVSVWASLPDLENYLHTDPHRGVMQRRDRWFVPLGRPATACWYVPAGHRPDLAECERALTRLWEEGSGDVVFALGQAPRP